MSDPAPYAVMQHEHNQRRLPGSPTSKGMATRVPGQPRSRKSRGKPA